MANAKRNPHLVELDGLLDFQSDKYPSCPAGKVPISTKDPAGQDLLFEYAHRREVGSHGSSETDSSFASAVRIALQSRGFVPLTHRPSLLDDGHTACGLTLQRFPLDRVLHLGEGETCPQCTHVVAQVAAARRATVADVNKATDTMLAIAALVRASREAAACDAKPNTPPARAIAELRLRLGHLDNLCIESVLAKMFADGALG